MPSLVDLNRALLNPVLAAADPGYLDALLAAASDAVEAYCKRRFALASYKLYLSGGGYPEQTVVLPNSPVASVDRVCCRGVPVLTVTNVDTVTNQLARVTTTAAADGSTAAVVLTRTASGVSSTATVAAAACPTLAALAAAIAAAGGGWAATVDPAWALYPTAELRPLQGPYSALRFAANLTAWVDGEVYGDHYRLDDEAGILYGHFPQGRSNLRVDYTAGFACVPESVQEAVVRSAQLALQAAGRDGNYLMEQLGPYEAQLNPVVPSAATDPQVRAWLSPWVSHSNLIAAR